MSLVDIILIAQYFKKWIIKGESPKKFPIYDKLLKIYR